MIPTHLKAMVYFGLKHYKRSQCLQHLKWFIENQYKPFYKLQWEREHLLIRLLKEAYHGVPGYREKLRASGITEGPFSMERLSRIAPLARMELVNNGLDFIHGNAEQRGFYYFKTGGSTGTPVKIGQDRYYRDWSLAANFFYNTWSGLTVGMPYFLLWGAYRDIHSQLKSWKDQFLIGFLQGRQVLNCRVTSPELLTSFIETINRHKECVHMVGYAYELYALACHSEEYGLPINRPFKAIYATAENLTDKMRETIERVFRCPIYNRYGCRDAGDLACECEFQTGFHINPLYSYIEVVDEAGRPLPYGEEGQILVTSLHNYSMPLIRYAVGDQGILMGPERCPCGREWETLIRLTSRVNEKIILPDGSWFGGAFFYTAFENLPHLKRYQVHQLSPDRLHIKLRSAIPNYTQQYAQELAEATRLIQTWCGFTIQIEYEQTETLFKTPTGKEPTVIRALEAIPEKIRFTPSLVQAIRTPFAESVTGKRNESTSAIE